MVENLVTDPVDDVATRIARRALAKRGADYASEVRRLLDAALAVMRMSGTGSRPRVADIVAAAGLSNDAFYRHFPSKDALVAAVIEDGAERLSSYVAHQMSKETDPRGQVRRWVAGVLSQAGDDIAAATLAVLWNAVGPGADLGSGPRSASAVLARQLHPPFTELGSAAPESDAILVAHAVVGALADHLWQRTRPTDADIDRITAFCLRAITPGAPGRAGPPNRSA
jgi:AcrR family transcriptional regulator